jgi:two-component system sensor histidine kinase/response regulator
MPAPKTAAPSTPTPDATSVRRRAEGHRVVIVYASFAAAWILISDPITALLFPNVADLFLASLMKGLLFVFISTALISWLLLRRLGPGDRLPAPPRRGSLLALGGLALGIAALTGFVIHRVIGQHEATEKARLQAIAELQTRQIADWMKEREGDAKFLRDSQFFADLYDRGWRSGRDEASRERLRMRLDEFRGANGYAAVLLLDPRGERLLGSSQASHEVAGELAAAARRAAQDRKYRIIGPYRDADGRLHLDILVPLIRVSGPAPGIALHIDTSIWLFPTLQSWPVPSASAETLLFRRDGGDVLFLNELRHRKNAAASLRIPISGSRTLAAQVLRAEAKPGAFIEGVDYRGTTVVGVSRPVAGTDWYLIAKMDRREILDGARQEAVWIGLTGLLVLLMASAGLILARQKLALEVADQSNQAQAERLRALRLLAAIADSSEDAIVAKDLEGRFLLFNRAAERLTGKQAQDVLGQDDTFIFPPEEARQMRAIGESIVNTDQLLIEEGTLTTVHGTRLFLSTMGPLHDDEGRVIGVYGISRDVTEHRRAEAELLDQMKRFRLLLDNSRDGIVIIDQDHKVVEANQRFADMLGYPPEELRALRTWDFDAVYDEQQIREGFSDLSLANRVFETRHRRKDGSEYDVEISASGARWSGQNLVLCVCRDISERKRIEAQLQLWANAFEHANFGLAIADARSKALLAVNPIFARERGYRPEELVGKPYLAMYPDDLHDAVKAQVTVLEKSGHGVFESEHLTRDGRRFPVLLDITVIKDANGEPRRHLAYALDISARKQAEAELLRQTGEIRQRNEELERFNRATVGRELDMIELKQRVNALSRELGREPPYPLAFLDGEKDAP